MSVFVFAGPTLSATDGLQELDAKYLPPAAQGDVYSVARNAPVAIGIIDGYFDRVPSIWHKEILWALSQGVHVFGASSMGALRAAELHTFGMVGIGKVFEAFASGELEDDDEVTVVHGSAETGYLAISEAMVNIRATVEMALRSEIIGECLARRLIAAAKRMHYPDRSFRRLLSESESWETETRGEVPAFRDWLPTGRIDQKREDALEMLRSIKELIATEPGPKEVRFSFHHTHMWELLRSGLEERPVELGAGAETHPADALLEELRLDRSKYLLERERAMVRALALQVAQQRGLGVDPWMSRREWTDGAGPEGSDDGQDVGPSTSQSLVLRVRELHRYQLERHFRDHLQETGKATDLEARSRHKQITLARQGIDNPSLVDLDLDESSLWLWYFDEHLDRAQPDDLETYAEELDFENLDAMRQAVLREYCYQHLQSDQRLRRAR